MCFPSRRTHVSSEGEDISLGICVSWVGEHISLENLCFPGRGTHITKDMCFPAGGEHISPGKTYH